MERLTLYNAFLKPRIQLVCYYSLASRQRAMLSLSQPLKMRNGVGVVAFSAASAFSKAVL